MFLSEVINRKYITVKYGLCKTIHNLAIIAGFVFDITKQVVGNLFSVFG